MIGNLASSDGKKTVRVNLTQVATYKQLDFIETLGRLLAGSPVAVTLVGERLSCSIESDVPSRNRRRILDHITRAVQRTINQVLLNRPAPPTMHKRSRSRQRPIQRGFALQY